MSEYGSDYAIAAPDGTRRYHGLMSMNNVIEGFNPSDALPCPAGTGMCYRRYAAFAQATPNPPVPALDALGLNASRLPLWATLGPAGGDIQIANCATPTSSTITLQAPGSTTNFISLGIKAAMTLRAGTNVPVGTVVQSVSATTVTVVGGGLTVNASFNTTQTFVQQATVPVQDYQRETAQLAVQGCDSTASAIVFVGVAVEDVLSGKQCRIASTGSITAVWCIPGLASNSVGSGVMATSVFGRVTGIANPSAYTSLGVILYPAGLDRAGTVTDTDFQSGSLEQVGILVAPR